MLTEDGLILLSVIFSRNKKNKNPSAACLQRGHERAMRRLITTRCHSGRRKSEVHTTVHLKAISNERMFKTKIKAIPGRKYRKTSNILVKKIAALCSQLLQQCLAIIGNQTAGEISTNSLTFGVAVCADAEIVAVGKKEVEVTSRVHIWYLECTTPNWYLRVCVCNRQQHFFFNPSELCNKAKTSKYYKPVIFYRLEKV